jgi:hypothetical protein
MDAGRYVAALAAIWLDATGELSPPTLKDICVRSHLLSPGRAYGFLQYLEHVGYIEAIEIGLGTRPSRYRATARFRADWIEHLRGPIAAAALIEPAAEDLLARLDDPHVATTFIEIQGRGLLQSAAGSALDPAIAEAFYHPLGGVPVLSMLLAGTEDDTVFPSRRPVVLPTAATAQALGISALQVRRILRRAIASGLLVASSGPAYALTALADAPLQSVYTAQLLQLLDPIGRMLAVLAP